MLGEGSIKLFRIFGIRVGASPSWFLVLFLFLYTLSRYFTRVLVGSSNDVAYAVGTIALDEGVADEQLHPFLMIECPRLLFPFARRVIADAVRDAGFPPFMLEPIDFNGLYLQQLAAQAAEAEAAGAPAGNA